MPKNDVHCAISKKRTRFNFKKLHQWIDKDEKGLGVNHRKLKHAYTTKEAKIIERYWDAEKGKGWGKKAVVEWLFHIAIDNIETAFKEANKAYKGNNAYNFFKFGLEKDSKFIHCEFDRLDEDELDEEFED